MKRMVGIVMIGLLMSGTITAAEPRHYIDIYGVGGVSSWNYPLEGGTVQIGGGFNAGLGYTFFFHPYVGLQTGLSITRYASFASLFDPMVWEKWEDGSPLTDYMGEEYRHEARIDHWRERQQAYLMEIPTGLRFRYFGKGKSIMGLHAALGVKMALPVLADYRLLSGEITHTGWYEQWQLRLYDLPDRFETEVFDNRQEESVKNRLQPVNAAAYAEIGTSFRLNPHWELFIAAFGQYMINDFSSVKSEERVALGFRTEHSNYPFMNEYHGLVGTDHVGAIHPWMAGLKIGLSVWPGKTEQEKKKDLKKLLKQFPDAVPYREIHDTVYLHDTVCLQEPVFQAIAHEEPVNEEMENLLLDAVIWFHFDDYTPILEPSYVLDSVASIMQRYPDLRIHVNGHACRIGTDRYNKRLALKRAIAVAEELKKKGVAGERMFIWSYGAQHPYRYNSQHQLSKDRRVEIIPY